MILAIFALLMAILLIASIFRPSISIAGLLCLYGLKQWVLASSSVAATYPRSVNLAVGGIVLLAFVLSLFYYRLNMGGYPAAGFAVIGLYGYALVSFFWTVDRAAFVTQWVAAAPYIIIFVVVSPFLLSSASDLAVGLLSAFILAFVLSILLFLTVNWHGRVITYSSDTHGNTSTAISGNPLAAAEMAGVALIVGVLMNFQTAAPIWVILRWVAVGFSLALMARSGSRGELYFAVAATVAFFPLSRGFKGGSALIRFAFIALLLFGVMTWAIYQFSADGRFNSNNTRDATQVRIDNSKDVLGYWAFKPPLGPLTWIIGIGNSGSFSPSVHGWYPEVHPVEILAEEGLIGGALWLAMIGCCIRSYFRLRVITRGSKALRGLSAAMLALVAYELLLSFKQGNFVDDVTPYAFAIILGRLERAVSTGAAPALPPEGDRFNDETVNSVEEYHSYEAPATF